MDSQIPRFSVLSSQNIHLAQECLTNHILFQLAHTKKQIISPYKKLLACNKALQMLLKKLLNLAQELYNLVYDTKIRNNRTFKLGQKVHTGKPPLPASFAGNVESLTATSYKKVMFKVTRPFHIFLQLMSRVSIAQS